MFGTVVRGKLNPTEYGPDDGIISIDTILNKDPGI